MAERFNRLLNQDCITGLAKLPEGCVDLAFADPPFNIGYEYDVYEDKQEREAYLDWSRRWIAAVHRVLSKTGTFWLAIGDEYAAELKLASQDVGFHCRSWVIWYYTFGVNCKAKFSRSHAHLFHFVKDSKEFTFRADELENRIPSARQLVYADTRANPQGRLPDDTWVLRPQDLADCFTPDEDTWYFPRVAGTFKERAGFHGCQMPEQLLGRIIRACSHPGNVVLDPFSGSATTAVVAKKLGRKYLAFDLSKEYIHRGQSRLDDARVGDPLDGAPEPTVSAPATPKGGKPRKGGRQPASATATTTPPSSETVSPAAIKLLHAGLIEAFGQTHDGYSLDRLVADPELNERLAEACRHLGLPGDARTWNWRLFRLRKSGALAKFPALKRTEIGWEDCEPYLFASEIAWRQLVEKGHKSLDHILCDPSLATEFDQIAARWSPGHTPLEYRWAAMRLRKSAKQVRTRASALEDVCLGEHVSLRGSTIDKLPKCPGIYLVEDAKDRRPLYAGEASNLRERIGLQCGRDRRDLWREYSDSLGTRYIETVCPSSDRLAYQRRVVLKDLPKLNFLDPGIA